MAEPIVVQFDLTADELAGLSVSKSQTVRSYLISVLLVFAGAAEIAVGSSGGENRGIAGFGVLVVLFGAFMIFGLTRVPKVRARNAARLSGPTKVQLSDRGVEYSGSNVAERLEWSRVSRVYDRPNTWSLLTKAPVTAYQIPKSAIPAPQQEAFATQLMAWSGSAYKFRKR